MLELIVVASERMFPNLLLEYTKFEGDISGYDAFHFFPPRVRAIGQNLYVI